MDDFLNGANSYEEACQLRNNLIKTMQSAGLELRKWSSNNINLIKDIPNNREGNKTKPISDDNSITKILGLFWNYSEIDIFQFEVKENNFTSINHITKCEILSEIACLF